LSGGGGTAVRARETGGAGERERGDWVRVWRGVGLYKAGSGLCGPAGEGVLVGRQGSVWWPMTDLCREPRQPGSRQRTILLKNTY
jgi:hypothetical protein